MSDDLTRLTDEERGIIAKALREAWRDNYSAASVVDGLCPAVESILAARATALIERAERAERERDEARQAHAELMQVAGEKYEALRERARVAASELGAKNGRLAAELAASRAAVTGLADEWDEQATEAEEQERTNISAFKQQFAFMARTNRRHASRLRALLPDEGDNG